METYVIEINVDTAEMCKHKVSDGICSLDRVRITDEGIEKPRVFRSYESERFFVGPHLGSY